jgi:hypothetical protein
MPFSARLSLAVMTVIGCVAPAIVHASGCRQDIAVPIHFRRGAVCWRHSGVGTTFNGEFGAHQHITASAIGETVNSDGKRTWTTTGPWQLYVTGPGGFSLSALNGQVNTVLPSSGTYSFSIGPCAVWGNKGTVEICAQ